MKNLLSAAMLTLGLACSGGAALAQLSNPTSDPLCDDSGMGADPACTGIVPRGSIRDMTGFRTYVVEQGHQVFTLSGVSVGAVLPASGVTYYEVPAQFGAGNLRYTIVNGHTVLIDPETRRVVQIID